jgi:hypothetical protein
VAEKIIYYAITDDFSSAASPGGVLRRTEEGDAKIDEVFSRSLTWKPSALLIAAERGDTMFDFTEITEAEADVIVARILAGGPSED